MKSSIFAVAAVIFATSACAQAWNPGALSTPVEKRIFDSETDAAVDVYRLLVETLTQFGEAPKFTHFCARQGFAVVSAIGNDGGRATATIDFLPDGKFAVRPGAAQEVSSLSDDQCR